MAYFIGLKGKEKKQKKKKWAIGTGPNKIFTF